MKLLIVDDSPNIRFNLRRFIDTIKGVQIIGEAEDEDRAVELALNKMCDVIILDIDLKNGSGFTVLKKIKEAKSKTIVIIFSNFVISSYKEKAQKEKADYVLDKHSDLDKLLGILEDLAKKY